MMIAIRNKSPFIVVSVLGIGIALVFFTLGSRDPLPSGTSPEKTSAVEVSPMPSSSGEPGLLPDENVDLDSLAREVEAEVVRSPNSAGHVIIASAETSDAIKTDALLKSFARGEAHLDHMRRENAFVTRRQIVELPETFAEIGDRLNSGEDIESIEIPGFDGETYTMNYDPTLMGPTGERIGTLIGNVPGEEASDVILGYYEGATSGYVNLPSQNTVLEYMTVGGNQIVVKEIDLEARTIAEPCVLCLHADGQAPHPAGDAHLLETRNQN